MANRLTNQAVPEEWKPVRRYEGYYEASSIGRIRRIRGGRGATAGRVLSQKPPNSTNDYCRVQLCRFDIKRTYAVHVLVAEAFHGKRPRGKFPNHKDLNKLNNCESNLEWLTQRQNCRHAIKNGRHGGAALLGGKNGRAKLTSIQVREIIAQKGKIGQRVLATLCGVSKSAIQFIHQGKHWKHEWPADLRIREYPAREGGTQ